ncbi:MAG: LysR family transcriptional regulator [Candidatus Thiodiazotropha sp.]
MSITHRQLEHALLLARSGNFTQAAAEANVSQSAFSRSIRKLEDSLGVWLFDRTRGPVTPTAFGEVLLRRAKLAVSEVEELEREISFLRGLDSGTLTVAFGIYPAEVSGNRAIADLVRLHPNLGFRVHVSNWEEVNRLVLSNAADVGFAAIDAALSDERFTVHPVSNHEMALFVSCDHPLANVPGITRVDLENFPLVSIRVPSQLADAVPGKADLNQDTGFLVPAVEVDDFSSTRTIVAGGSGIGAVVPLQIEASLQQGEFVLLDYARPWLSPTHGFILKRGRAISPAAQAFMDRVLDVEVDAGARNQDLIERFHPGNKNPTL